jgi:hypothetical protein
MTYLITQIAEFLAQTSGIFFSHKLPAFAQVSNVENPLIALIELPPFDPGATKVKINIHILKTFQY